MSSIYENTPLPDGWIREIDPKTKHPFWVDTKVKPPRSIWVHPFEDEQFLSEHPDIRERLERERPSDDPPPYEPRRHSYSGSPSGSHLTVPEVYRPSHSQPGRPAAGLGQPQGQPQQESQEQQQQRRGFFGKLKDKAIGTKEEREARHRAEQELMAEQRRRWEQEQRSYGLYNRYPGQFGAPYGPTMYAAPAGNPYLMGTRRNGGGFGGGLAFPLLAGAAGGLLLGDMLDGGFGGGGFDNGWGGGGFF